MKINRVQQYYSLQAGGKDMAKKKAETDQAKKTGNTLDPTKPANESDGLARITPAGKAPDAAPSQIVDQYISTRQPSELPVRNDRIEHARSMIKQGYYNDPKVVDEIINRLVHAIKE